MRGAGLVRGSGFVAKALVALGLLSTPRDADAACVQGARLGPDHTCRLHLVTGPVLAPARVLGLAGAYQGIAEGLAGYAVNAAAPAVREPWSSSWFDYDLDASISIPSAFRRIDDLEYDGVKENFDYGGFIFVTLGANAQLGPWGLGVTTDLQRFDLTPDAQDGQERYAAVLTKTRILAARSLLDGDLVIGGGVRHIGFDIDGTTPSGDSTKLVSVSGLAPEIGMLYRPDEASFRVGATYRFPVTTGQFGDDDQPRVANWWVPRSVNLPWELDLGVAFQGGPRPLNVHWPNPHEDEERLREDVARARAHRAADRATILAGTPLDRRDARARELADAEASLRAMEDREIEAFPARLEAQRKARYRALPRDYLLFTLGLLVTGSTPEGISLESFFTQEIARAGAVTTYSPRAGVETELVPNLFRPRIGTYIEPSRFTLQPDWRAFRQHVTAGFDLFLLRWRVFGLYPEGSGWRVTFAVDVSHNSWNYGLSIGLWR